ncbi:membrane-targeted effector domain-containing toxin [Legionella tunisiensis]|uniref:membrane-targeted effector domain-containing toxin n=1 Tax=Legionella tunisiensis TaxID=1034944 RepID=UPI0003180C71|nr:membrane-targeted effector domain-containing toxin [Legionella tunisiensis]
MAPVYSIHPSGKFYNWKTAFGFDHRKDDVRELVIKEKYQKRYQKFKEEILTALPGHIEYDNELMRIDIVGFSPDDYHLLAIFDKLQKQFPWLHELSHYQTLASRHLQAMQKKELEAKSLSFFSTDDSTNNNTSNCATKSRSKVMHFSELWKNNLVISEAHEYICSKKFIIKNLHHFKAEGYDTLFLEHIFNDTMQIELDNYMQSPPDADMSPLLQDYLNTLDRGHLFNSQQQFLRKNGINPAEVKYTFTNLVIAVKKAGIRIVGLNTSLSYAMQKVGIDSVQEDTPQRIRVFNFKANSIVEQELIAGRTKKWLALMGNTHAEQFEGYPGVSQLQGAQTIIMIDNFHQFLGSPS